MKYFDWDPEKNEKLQEERDIGFEDILIAIEEGGLVAVLEHPNTRRYSGQKILVVIVRAYGYLVPYVEDEQRVFLKTIIPSRKATKRYITKQ